ncbi:MAG: hypothetical protein AAGC73_08200 [Verrucomicrobiota bacterium]
MKLIFIITLTCSLLTGLILASGCGSTRVENGVMIQEAAPSYNPFDYIPGFK